MLTKEYYPIKIAQKEAPQFTEATLVQWGGRFYQLFANNVVGSAKTLDIDRIRVQQQLEEYDGLELVTKKALVLDT